MRSLVVAVLAPAALVLAARSASASSCQLGPFSIVTNPRLGCDVIVVDIPSGFPADPTVSVQRGAEWIDVTGTVTETTMSVESHYVNYACDGSVIQQYTMTEEATVHRITVQGAIVGDTIYVGGIHSGVVQEAGACSEDFSQLNPYCTGRNSGYPCEGDGGPGGVDDPDDMTKVDDAVGCNTGGTRDGAGLALLVLLATVGRWSSAARRASRVPPVAR